MYNVAVISSTVINRQLISDLLRLKNYRVRAYHSWGDFRQSAGQISDYSLFILDHDLGNEQIQAAVHEIRLYEKNRIPVMLISPSSHIDEIMAMSEKGVDDYVVKPVNPDAFFTRVKKIFELYPTRLVPQYPDNINMDLATLISWEILRAKRGNYAFSIIRLSVDPGSFTEKEQPDHIKLINFCYEILEKLFRKTDILIGDHSSLLLLCPFADQTGVKVVLRKVINSIRKLGDDRALHFIEAGYATFPDNAWDENSLLSHASKNQEPLEHLSV